MRRVRTVLSIAFAVALGGCVSYSEPTAPPAPDLPADPAKIATLEFVRFRPPPPLHRLGQQYFDFCTTPTCANRTSLVLEDFAEKVVIKTPAGDVYLHVQGYTSWVPILGAIDECYGNYHFAVEGGHIYQIKLWVKKESGFCELSVQDKASGRFLHLVWSP
jgi:hypothetical protein